MVPLCGCDTFVVMPDVSATGEVVFGKNSDRPSGEVQEVVYVPSAVHAPQSTVKCTYIEIPQAEGTFATILSKPSWMWGAEMGANEKGVVIGNEAVWDRLIDSKNDLVPRLLGMDLVRLGLERGGNAKQAVDTIISLLETHGQGGACSDVMPNFSYHNSYLIADAEEAWILETADRFWASERITHGYRNISNCMSITTNMHSCSENLKETAKAKGWWNGRCDFNWTEVITGSDEDDEESDSRWGCGTRLLKNKTGPKDFSPNDMMDILRDKRSGINMDGGGFETTASQVSVVSKDPNVQSCHWFTATTGPSRSAFKPFIFSNNVALLTLTVVGPPPVEGKEGHPLWCAQHSHRYNTKKHRLLSDLEKKYFSQAESERCKRLQELKSLFEECVKDEMKLYESEL